jgi:hypothetical protein
MAHSGRRPAILCDAFVGKYASNWGWPDLMQRARLKAESCSPFRVPIARLTAAQAAIGE